MMKRGALPTNAGQSREANFLPGASDPGSMVVYTIDHAYRVMTANAIWDAFDQTHHDPQALIGTHFLDGLANTLQDEFRHICDPIFSGELAFHEYELDCSEPDQPRFYALAFQPLFGLDGHIAGATFISRKHEARRPVDAASSAQQQVQALERLIMTLNQGHPIPEAMEILLSVTDELLQPAAVALYVPNEDRTALRIYAQRGLASEQPHLALQGSLAGRTYLQGQPQQLSGSALLNDLTLPRLQDGRVPDSLYAVPVQDGDAICGILEVCAVEQHSFDEHAHALLTTLAASAGIAFTNARLVAQEAEAHKAVDHFAHLAAEQSAREQTTISALSDGVWICNRAGTIDVVNDAGLRMFGLERGAVVGQPLSVLAHLLTVRRGERRRLGLRLALQGEAVRATCEVITPGESNPLTVDFYATPVRDEDGTVIGAVALARNVSQALTVERMRDDFLSIAAHELKTPITALKGYAQLALKRVAKLPDAQGIDRTLETINEQADRITGLVNKLLDASHIRSGQLDLVRNEFDLQGLIVSVADATQIRLPGYVVNVASHAPVFIVADRERLEEVMYNLLDNAAKYSKPGIPIEITTKVATDSVIVVVHDQGLGIPVERLPYIFDQWYQAHDMTYGDYGGMGLGLYICKEIVERHGGSIWVTSNDGEGTTVGFAIPRMPGRVADVGVDVQP